MLSWLCVYYIPYSCVGVVSVGVGRVLGGHSIVFCSSWLGSRVGIGMAFEDGLKRFIDRL